MPMTRFAIVSCRQRTRSAEHRCPAESKAEASTSPTTCSGNAEESTIMAFWPPVSAMKGMLPRSASAAWMWRATSVEPVNSTAFVPGSATSAAPTSPAPGRSCKTSRGTPALCRRRTACAPVSGVCSAGLASTGFPAASAAAIWPVKIASGKFHGLMQTASPSGSWPGS